MVEHNAKGASAELLKVYEGLPVTNDDDREAESDVTIVIGADFRF